MKRNKHTIAENEIEHITVKRVFACDHRPNSNIKLTIMSVENSKDQNFPVDTSIGKFFTNLYLVLSMHL